MTIAPNKFCEECGARAVAACDGWDDAKNNYCDRTMCDRHIRKAGETGFHFCARHTRQPLSDPAITPPPAGQMSIFDFVAPQGANKKAD